MIARLSPGAVAMTLCALGSATVLLTQTLALPGDLEPGKFLSAGNARPSVVLHVVAAATIAGWAVRAPPRLRWVAVAVPALALTGGLAAAAVGAGVALGILSGVLVMAACWGVGERALRWLGVAELAALAPVAWVAGAGVLANVVLGLGRLGLLHWWSVGLGVAALGVSGLVRLGRSLWAAREVLGHAVLGGPLTATCAGLILLQAAWAAIYAAAPEVSFDALYVKAWLPELWAHTGRIGPLYEHPPAANIGFSQLLAVPGHVFHTQETGRWMQYLAGSSLAATVWWWGRRYGAFGPLAALAVALAPHVLWQQATAYDDLLLAFGAVGLGIGVVVAIEGAGSARHPLRAGIAVGGLVGAVVGLKLHLAPLAGGLALGWLMFGGPRGAPVRRLEGLVTGAVAVAAPAFVIRAIDYENPLFPLLSGVFPSPYWPQDVGSNLPIWRDPPAWGLLTWIGHATQRYNPLNEGAPTGMLGLLLVALVAALLVGPLLRRHRTALVLWAGLVLAMVGWWVELRYLRYLLPTAGVALLLLPLAFGRHPLEGRAAIVLSALAGVASAVYFPASVGQNFFVPYGKVPFGAARGTWDRENYRQAAFSEYSVLKAFERLAEPPAIAVGKPHQRLLLEIGHDLSPIWELNARMGIDGWPPDQEATRRRMAELGVEWVITQRPESELVAPLLAVTRAKGEIVYAADGWMLLRLVERPVRPRRVPACDVPLRSGSCTLPACPGQTILLTATVPAGSAAGQGQIVFDDPRRDVGTSVLALEPGTTQLAGTAPLGSRQVTLTVTPGPGGSVERSEVAATGATCRAY